MHTICSEHFLLSFFETADARTNEREEREREREGEREFIEIASGGKASDIDIER